MLQHMVVRAPKKITLHAIWSAQTSTQKSCSSILPSSNKKTFLTLKLALESFIQQLSFMDREVGDKRAGSDWKTMEEDQKEEASAEL